VRVTGCTIGDLTQRDTNFSIVQRSNRSLSDKYPQMPQGFPQKSRQDVSHEFGI
jgi:hypothetical protein